MLLEAQHLLAALQDTETAQRSYVMTARPGFLEPYEAGRKEVGASLDRLAEMTLDSPIQQARIRELGNIIAAKIAELSEVVALVQAGDQPGAVAIITNARGKSRTMARSIVGAAIAEEQRQQSLLSVAVDEAFNRDRHLSYALAAVGLFTLLGAAMAAVLALRQITRTQLSAQLVASEDRLRLLVERAPAAIAMFDRNMRYLLANRRYIRDYKLHDAVDKGVLINHSHYEVFPECTQDRRKIHRRVLAGETLCADDDEFPRADGSTDWMRWEMTPWHQADGTIGGAMLFSEVTTARKQVESRQALLLELACRQRRTTPDETMDAAAAALGSHLSVSRVGYGEIDVTAERVTMGYEYRDGMVAAAIGTLDLSVLGAEIIEDLRAGRTLVVTDVVSDHRTRERSPPHQAMDTRSLIVVPLVRQERLHALLYLAHREPRTWTTGEVELIEEVATRTWAAVEQARMKVALERTAEEFLTLAEGLPVLCWMAEPDGHVYWYNQRWYDFTGTTRSEMEGWGWQSVYDPEALPSALERWRVSLSTGEPLEMTFPLRGADGVFRMFLTRIVPVHDAEGRVRRWLGTNVDVAEAAGREAALERSAAALREREARLLQAHNELESRVIEEVKAREAAQTRLAQAEKLSALGQLAGGIAHDFNNVMQAVSGGASLIGRHADSADTVKRLSKLVEDAAWRGASVTRRLLAFARRGELRAAPVQITALLYGLREILAHTLGSAIRVELDVAQGLPAVLADGSQLESVVVNLATNARDAMPQGGTITIAATPERIMDNGHAEGLEPGTYVRLTVADTGTGIEAATLPRVMEPFFTTKEQGKGTGLGLPMARGFAQQSGGALTISSDPGLGTVVALWLPVSGTEIVRPDHSRKPAASINGEKKPSLLLVEDEEVVREVVAEQLIDRGYDVIEAEGGRRALALLDAGCPVDLIISDLSMPGMDGVSLIRAAQIRKPRLPAILLTGYAGETAALAVGRGLDGSFSLLRKPVTGDHLADRVATLLQASAMGRGGETAAPLRLISLGLTERFGNADP